MLTHHSADLKHVGDSTLYECLRDACLEHLLDKDKVEWDARLNWAGDALSHGEKQKLAMARLFFHTPRFAILDECSSAIDIHVEQKLYSKCEEKGITLLTIAHRRSVWRYHNWVLRFDGNGGFMFSQVTFPASDVEMAASQTKAVDGSGGGGGGGKNTNNTSDAAAEEDDSPQMVLVKVKYASDAAVIGKEVVVRANGTVDVI